MSSLFGLLSIGQGAVNAQRAGAAITGRNIANANTQGYSRESIRFESQPLVAFIGGVATSNPERSQSDILSRREREASSELGFAQSLLGAASALEQQLVGDRNELPRAITDLFSSFSRLSASPQDSSVRQEVISKAKLVAGAFQGASQKVSAARADADQSIQTISKEATRLAGEVAAANRAMVSDKDPMLADKRDQAAKDLAALTGAQARIDPDGQMRVTLQGKTLVDGKRASSVVATPDPALGGLVKVTIVDGVHSDDVTATLTGGELGGALQFRDVVTVSTLSKIDQLAFDLTSQVNTVHRANAGLDGVSGRDLFVQPTAAAGAAKGFSVDPAITADDKKLASAAVGAGPGDNTGALALSALSTQSLAGANLRSFFDEAINSLTSLGQTVLETTGRQDIATAKVDSLASARDSLSGVSLEDELSQLAIFQHASEASLRFISTVNQMMGDLLREL
jgi:flagellar hook-associated protein 1